MFFAFSNNFHAGTEIAKLFAKRDMNIQGKRLVRLSEEVKFLLVKRLVNVFGPLGRCRITRVARALDIEFADCLLVDKKAHKNVRKLNNRGHSIEDCGSCPVKEKMNEPEFCQN